MYTRNMSDQKKRTLSKLGLLDWRRKYHCGSPGCKLTPDWVATTKRDLREDRKDDRGTATETSRALCEAHARAWAKKYDVKS